MIYLDFRLVAKNASILAIAGVLAKAVAAVVGIFVTRYLGPGAFGDYSTAYAFVGSFILFTELGISQLMVQEGSRDESVIPKYFGNTLLVKTLIAVLVYILMLIFMYPAGYSQSVQNMIIILGLAVGFNALNQSAYNYYQTKELMSIAAGYQFLTTLLIALMTMVVILTGSGVIAITFTHLLSYILTSILLFFALRGKIRPVIRMKELPSMVVKGLPFGVQRIFYNIYFQLSILMLSFMCTNVEVGIFSAAYKLVLMLAFLPSLLTSAVYPVLYQLGVTDKDMHRNTVEKVFKMLASVGIPGSILMCVLAKPFTIWLYDGKFNESIPILMIVSWFLALECMSFAIGDVLTTTDRQWLRSGIQGFGVLALYLLIKFLYPLYGIYGAAYALMIVEAYIFIGYYSIVHFRVYKIRIWRQLPAITGAAVVLAFTAFFLRNIHPLVASAVAGTLYLAVLVVIDEDFRKIGGYIWKRGLAFAGMNRRQ